MIILNFVTFRKYELSTFVRHVRTSARTIVGQSTLYKCFGLILTMSNHRVDNLTDLGVNRHCGKFWVYYILMFGTMKSGK